MKADICPVCIGKGTVPAGFYVNANLTGTSEQTCKSCNGNGYIVIPKDHVFPIPNPYNGEVK